MMALKEEDWALKRAFSVFVVKLHAFCFARGNNLHVQFSNAEIAIVSIIRTDAKLRSVLASPGQCQRLELCT